MRRLSFTLVELIVAISIIALLITILLCVLQSSRRHARSVLCGSHIKQLALGLLTYETENETFPHAFDNTPKDPPLSGYPGSSVYDRRGWWWFNHIIDYSRKDHGGTSIVLCPDRHIRRRGLEDYVLRGNYGVNQSICKSSSGRSTWAEFIGRPSRAADVPYPSETLLVVDSGYSMINWWHATDSPPVVLGNSIIEDTAYIPGLWINKKRALWPGQEEDAINGRHPNKTVNVGFTDGHVSSNKADDLCVEKTNDEYKNLCPLWLPK